MWLAQGQRRPIPAQPAMLVIMRASIINAVIAKEGAGGAEGSEHIDTALLIQSKGFWHNARMRENRLIGQVLPPDQPSCAPRVLP